MKIDYEVKRLQFENKQKSDLFSGYVFESVFIRK